MRVEELIICNKYSRRNAEGRSSDPGALAQRGSSCAATNFQTTRSNDIALKGGVIHHAEALLGKS
jgi:hypothetical protein